MRTSLRLLSSAALLITLVACDADTDRAKYSEEAEATAKQLRQKIRDEVRSLGEHAWAGEYYHGDGLGVNVFLMLAPQAGYLFEWHGCLGLYDRNYGKVSCTDEVVVRRYHASGVNRSQANLTPSSGLQYELVPIKLDHDRHPCADPHHCDHLDPCDGKPGRGGKPAGQKRSDRFDAPRFRRPPSDIHDPRGRNRQTAVDLQRGQRPSGLVSRRETNRLRG